MPATAEPDVGSSLRPKELVLLGLLAERPSHAYAIEETIRERRMDEWTEIALSSIYRLLDKLAQRGLADATLEQAGQGAARKVYAITKRGHRALAEGVAHYLADLDPPKNPFHVSLANLTEAPKAQVIEMLEARAVGIDAIGAQLGAVDVDLEEELEAAHDERTDEYKLRVELLFSHIQHHLRAERAFLSEALTRLKTAPTHLFANADSRRSKK